MIRTKMLPNNEVAIIEDRQVYLFNRRNEFETVVDMTPKYTNGMQNLPIISVLSTNGGVDVAFFTEDDVMTYVENPKEAMDCMMILQSSRDYIRMLQRNGKENNVRYNQMLYIYPVGTNIRGKETSLSK